MDSCSFAPSPLSYEPAAEPFSFKSFTKVPPFAAEKAPQVAAPAPSPFKLIVKTMTGCITVLDVTSNKTIKDVKDMLADPRFDAYQNASLRIIVGGKAPKDTDKLSDFGMSFASPDAERTVHAVTRIRGGMFHPSSSRADFTPLGQAPPLIMPLEIRVNFDVQLDNLRKRLLEEGIRDIEIQIRRRTNSPPADADSTVIEEIIDTQRARCE